MQIRALQFLLPAVALAACSYKVKSRTVSMSQIGDPKATRIYSFMSNDAGGEETRVDHLMDEAVISMLRPGEACFDLTVRSNLDTDLHPSQWVVKLNGAESYVEEVAPSDTSTWKTTYTEQEVVVRRTTPRGETTITRPVEYEATRGYTVRFARACGPIAQGASKLRLEVELKHPFGTPDWGQIFEWNLRS